MISKALLVTAAVTASGVVLADNPAWTFAQVGYIRADSGDDTTDAVTFKGSVGFAENFHFQGQYSDGDVRDLSFGGFAGTNADVDFDGYELNLGFNPSVGANTDAVIAVKYFDFTYDVPANGSNPARDVDVDGFGIGGGMRHMIADNVELNTMVWWNEGDQDFGGAGSDDGFSDIEVEIGGRYFFTDAISGGLTAAINDALLGGDSATFDLRWQFADFF
jgi:hypothetical protein